MSDHTLIDRLLDAEPQAPSRRLRATLLAAAAPGPDAWIEGYVARTAEFFDVDREAAREVLTSLQAVDQEPWFDDQVAGVRMRRVEAGPRLAGATSLLVSLEPGVAYPEHRHLGDEWCLFLRGVGVEGEREWRPGDLVRKPAQSVHPVLSATPDERFAFALVIYDGVEFLP